MAKQKREISRAETENAEAASKVEQEIEAARASAPAVGTVAGRAPHEFAADEASGSSEADLERKQAEELGDANDKAPEVTRQSPQRVRPPV